MTKRIRQRKFKCSVPVMLISSLAAAVNMEKSLHSFADDYPAWTAEKLQGYMSEIEQMGDRVGIKAVKEQREATVELNKISIEAIDHAAIIKSQMISGYRKEPERMAEVEQILGFSKNWKRAQIGNQSALLDLVYTITNNTDEPMKKELVDHGIALRRIDALKELAPKLTLANVTQESLKSESPAITAAINENLNEIFDTAMDICRAGKTVFRRDPVMRAQFSFSRLVAQQSSGARRKSGDDPADTDSAPSDIDPEV